MLKNRTQCSLSHDHTKKLYSLLLISWKFKHENKQEKHHTKKCILKNLIIILFCISLGGELALYTNSPFKTCYRHTLYSLSVYYLIHRRGQTVGGRKHDSSEKETDSLNIYNPAVPSIQLCLALSNTHHSPFWEQ